jgi:hypothetical protein
LRGPVIVEHSCAGIMQLRSDCRNEDPAKNRPPTTHFIVSVARKPEVSKVQSLTKLRLAIVGGDGRSYKGPISMQVLPALRTHTANAAVA